MKLRTLVTVGLLSASPSLLLAQSQAEPLPAVAPQAPTAAGVARTVVAPAPATAAELSAPPALPAPEAPQAPPTPKPATAPAPAAPPALLPPPRPQGQMLNVRIDVTLSDSKGPAKVLTMTVADGEGGMNRTTSFATVGSQGVDYSFNADASPNVVGNRIRLRLTADAVVPVEGEKAGGPVPKLALRQSQTLVLDDGKPVEIARAADPVSDRAFTLTVKATIQR